MVDGQPFKYVVLLPVKMAQVTKKAMDPMSNRSQTALST